MYVFNCNCIYSRKSPNSSAFVYVDMYIYYIKICISSYVCIHVYWYIHQIVRKL